jgi:purine-nucleoside phosphorylase
LFEKGHVIQPTGGRIDMRVSGRQIESYYYGRPADLGSKIVFIKRAARLAAYRPYLADAQNFGNVWQGISGSYQGKRVSIIAAGIGPSMIGDAIYALDRPNAICLYSGTCGGLVDGMAIGDYFVAEQAVCGDGFSFHLGHRPWSMVAGDPQLLDALSGLLVKKVAHAHHGLAFTTASVVREAELDFWSQIDAKCQVIEMGAAAFYAAAQTTGKGAAAYYWVTDLPRQGKSFFDPPTAEETGTKQACYDRAVSLDLELLASL